MKWLAALLILVLVRATLDAAPLAGSRPNIIFIITDDQGSGDLSCHGNPVLKTPNLDRLHAEGARFIDFQVSPTCAPTRAALMTGRHEFMSGVTHTINERERLALSSATIAQVLQEAGYTTGIFGKWHLGDEEPYQPQRRGFDEVFIHGAGGIGQSYAGSCGDAPGNRYQDPAIRHNGTFVRTKGYCTDLFFAQAMKWMDTVKDKPFYCQIATNAPHAPLDCPAGYEEKYSGKAPPMAAKFFGMIANIDDNTGRLLAWLDERKLADRTLVIFMNDNGGTAGCSIHNQGMHGQKGSPWRGGVRAASFWRWPGKIAPGDRPQLAAHLDFFPAIAAFAGAKLKPEVAEKLEGRSLLPPLEDPAAPWADRFLFTHTGRWERGEAAQSKYRQCSVRWRHYTLVNATNENVRRWSLHDLNADPGEKKDIAREHPDIVAGMESAYDRWWTGCQPCMVNEDAAAPPVNAFRTAWIRQFGETEKK